MKKYTALLLSIIGLLLASASAHPNLVLKPHLGCTSVGLINKTYPKLGGGPEYLVGFHRFRVRVQMSNDVFYLYVDKYISGADHPMRVFEERYNNLGQNIAAGFSYDTLRTYAGIGPASQNGADSSYVINTGGQIDMNWELWTEDQTNQCNSSAESPTHALFFDANGWLTAISILKHTWYASSWNGVGYTWPQHVELWSAHHKTISPRQWNMVQLGSMRYWSAHESPWVSDQSNSSAGAPMLVK